MWTTRLFYDIGQTFHRLSSIIFRTMKNQRPTGLKLFLARCILPKRAGYHRRWATVQQRQPLFTNFPINDPGGRTTAMVWNKKQIERHRDCLHQPGFNSPPIDRLLPCCDHIPDRAGTGVMRTVQTVDNPIYQTLITLHAGEGRTSLRPESEASPNFGRGPHKTNDVRPGRGRTKQPGVTTWRADGHEALGST